MPLDLTLNPAGTWTGTIGDAKAWGRAEGPAAGARGHRALGDGHEDPVCLSLIGDDTRRSGETLARFGGREER